MSTKNFVSNGDMETLMSGIKDAIDGAGGGSEINKVVVASYTRADGNRTIENILWNIFRAPFNALSDDIKIKCKSY